MNKKKNKKNIIVLILCTYFRYSYVYKTEFFLGIFYLFIMFLILNIKKKNLFSGFLFNKQKNKKNNNNKEKI